MATYITESIIIESEFGKIEIFLNSNYEMVIEQIDNDIMNPFFFTLTKQDWVEMKKFIDSSF